MQSQSLISLVKSQDYKVPVYIKPWKDGSLNVCHVLYSENWNKQSPDVSINFWLN